jgi:hypothetical protein
MVNHIILSRVTVIKTRFGLVIGLIGYLQVVTTNNYNIIADLHNLQSLNTNLLSLSALVLMDSPFIDNQILQSFSPCAVLCTIS